MMGLLHLQQLLKATIYKQKFLDLKLNDSAWSAVVDIHDNKFWKCLYILLRAVFPALKALRYCDANKPAMDKIFYLSHKTTVAIENSIDSLNDKDLFGSIQGDLSLHREGNIVLGETHDDDDSMSGDEAVVFQDVPSEISEDDLDDNNYDGNDETLTQNNDRWNLSFGRQILWHWEKRKNKIEHEYAVLCVMPEVHRDFQEQMTGHHRDMIEIVANHLHLPPCPNTNPLIAAKSLFEIVDIFWNEFKSFQNSTHPYHEPCR
jgi:hypothetical protein